MLQKRAHQIEKLKRENKKLELENARLQRVKNSSSSFSASSRISQRKILNNQQDHRRNKLKNIMKAGKEHLKQNEEWMSQGLDHTIQHFNEMFMNNLSLSISQNLINEEAKPKVSSSLNFAEITEESLEELKHQEKNLSQVESNQSSPQKFESPKKDETLKSECDSVLQESPVNLANSAEIEEEIKMEDPTFPNEEDLDQNNPKVIEKVIESDQVSKGVSKEMQDQIQEQKSAV